MDNEDVEKLKKDIEELKKRCSILTVGSLCRSCNIECEYRIYRFPLDI